MRILAFRLLPVVAGLVLASCASLPDTSGYTSATIQVKQSVAVAGDVVEAEIASAAAGLDEASPAAKGAAQQSGTFRKAWNTTMVSLDAMVDYAESIEAIVASGNDGADSARKVADSVSALAAAAGITPAAGPVNAATATAAFVYGEIAKIRSAKSLENALAQSGPAVVMIQSLVREQALSARAIFELAMSAQARALRSPEAYGTFVTRDDELVRRERELLDLLAHLTIREPESRDIAARKAALKQVTEVRGSLKPHVDDYKARLADLDKRRKAGLSVLGAADTALAAWATAHEKLVVAVRDRRPVTMESLTAAVADVQTVIQKWREL